MALADVLGAALPALGGVVGGAPGAAVGAFAGGLFQQGEANRKMKEWNRLDRSIPENDPMQQALLGKIQRQENQYRAATDPASSLANRLAQQAGAQTQANLSRAGGPGIVQNLLSSQNATQRNLAQVGANAALRADQMLGMEGQLTGLMAERRYDRQRYRRDLALMQGQQRQQDANNQMMSAIPLLPQVQIGQRYQRPAGIPSAQPGGAYGPAWRNQGTGLPVPPSPSDAPQYAMIPEPMNATSTYEPGTPVNL